MISGYSVWGVWNRIGDLRLMICDYVVWFLGTLGMFVVYGLGVWNRICDYVVWCLFIGAGLRPVFFIFQK